MNEARGQAAVLGLILLIGIVAITSVGILVYAGTSTTDAQQEMENDRIEGSFVQLSQTMASTAATGDTTEVIDFAAGEHGAVVMTNTSRMTITHGNDSEDIYFGTIEYEGDDGTKIAYQAGGVFRETGNETQVVSAPPIHYDGKTGAETLSFPITEAANEAQLSSGEITISKNDTDVKYSNRVDREYVTIEIEGPYHRGWEQYFARQAGEEAIQEVDHANDTVTVKLGQSAIDALYEHGAVTSNNIDTSGPAGIGGPVLAGGNVDDQIDADDGVDENVDLELEPIDDEVGEQIDEADANNWADLPPSGTITAETNSEYFDGTDEDLDLNGRTFNLSKGNITVVVDGDVDVGDTTIEGTESGNELHMYVNGSLDISGNDALCIEKCYDPDKGDTSEEDINANHFEIYGTSAFDISGNGGGTAIGEGIVFAPSADIVMGGTPQWNGAIIADSLEFNGKGSNDKIIYDEELEGGPSLHAGVEIPDVTYLNVVRHEVDVEN